MKKWIAFLILLFLPVSLLFSQEYEFYENQSGNWVKIPNGTMLTRTCTVNSDGVDEFFGVKNIASDTRLVWARKQRRYMTPEANDSYCWNGCMQSYDSLSYKYLSMEPGKLIVNQFDIHFRPGSKPGNTLISYSFFDRSHLADSGFMQILYVIQPVGIEEADWITKTVVATPNPASNLIRFLGIPDRFSGALTLVNLVGQELISIPINAGHSEVTFNSSGLPNGIYFYFLQMNGSKGAVRKLMINR